MEYPDTNFNVAIKKDVPIGTAVFVVEGKDEFKLLERLFCDIYGYVLTVARHKRPGFSLMVSNFGRIVIVNAKDSAAKFIESFDEFFDEVYEKVFIENNIDIRYSPVYYLWDRDPHSNIHLTKNFIEKHNISRNEANYMDGMLLISYPQIEIFTISKHEYPPHLPVGKPFKKYIKSKKYSLKECFNVTHIENAFINMARSVNLLGIVNDWTDVNNLSSLQPIVFDKEENMRLTSQYYEPLSMLMCALIELGLIVIG